MFGPGTSLRTTPPPRTAVFLLRRRPLIGAFSGLNPFYLGVLKSRPLAVLQLTDTTVRCVLVNKYGHARWLAERLQMPDLKDRLKTEEVTVFEFPRGGYEIKWPKLDMGMLCEIGEPGSDRWITSFSLPRDEHVPPGFSSDWDVLIDAVAQVAALRDGAMREVRRLWRQALDPNGSQVPSGG
jgi:hypothetical protein